MAQNSISLNSDMCTGAGTQNINWWYMVSFQFHMKLLIYKMYIENYVNNYHIFYIFPA